MSVHLHGAATATVILKTTYGTFAICPECIRLGHMGAHTGNTRPWTTTCPCQCEHADHFAEDEREELNDHG